MKKGEPAPLHGHSQSQNPAHKERDNRDAHMRDARRVGAFFSGLILYCAAIGCGILLARVSLPDAVYKSLGGRDSLATVLSEAAVIGLLLFLLALVWSYLTVRPRAKSKSRHTTTAWCLSGLGLAWLGWLIYGVVNFALNPLGAQTPMSALLFSADVPPLWGLLNVVAVVSGAVVAGMLARPAPAARPA